MFLTMSRKFRQFACLSLAGLLASCGTGRYLKDGERILNRQTIQAPKSINKDEMENLYVKKANRKLFGFLGSHLVWMYYTGKRHYKQEKFILKRDRIEARFNKKLQDSSRLRSMGNIQFRRSKKIDHQNMKIENGNDFMRWGEPLALFDSLEIRQTLDRFDDYLFSRGYLHGQVSAKWKVENRKVRVAYQIEPGPAFIIDSVFLKCPSEKAAAILASSEGESKVRPGDRFNQEKMGKERERIELLLRDHGFFNFSRQMVSFDADTTLLGGNRMVVGINIDAPPEALRQFRIDTVRIVPDVGMDVYFPGERNEYAYRGVNFRFFGKRYHKKVLTQRIFIHRDSLYNRSLSFLTQKQLANLDMFKFVNINYDTIGRKFTANIFASPLENYAWSNEAGVSVTQGFPGPYYSLGFKRRNLFRGLEIFELNGRFGFEGVASATSQNDFYKSTEANINGSVTFPQFLLPISGDAAIRFARFNPRSRLLAGYTYTSRPEYQRSIITASSTLTWEKSNQLQFSFTGTNLSIIRSDTSAQFGERLRELEKAGNRLINAFKPAFVSSMSFSVTWNKGNYGTNARSTFLRASIESGGTTLNIFSPSIITDWGLQPYQYIRLNVDLRKTELINRNTLFAYRMNAGVGYAYSANKVMPYEKNFFVGGSNSVRAWRPRRLGPGSLAPALSSNPENNGRFDYRFEKPGDLLLEGSAELRQKLFGFVNYAVFLDVGNVWSLQSNTNPAAKFKLNSFLKEFGVGTGFGLRFDFTFLILRLDAGIKVLDPGRPVGDRFVLNKARFFKPFGTDREPVIFNIGIGYPF